MKKYINYLLVLAAGLFVMSCSDKDDYKWGPKDPEDGSKTEVYFAKSGESLELDPAEEVISVTINRKDPTGDITVPLIVKWNQEGVFEVPESVDFADGSATASFDVNVAKALVGKEYTLEIGVPDDNYYLYKPLGVAGAISYKVDILKLAWSDLFTGTYICACNYGGASYGGKFPAVMQKCESIEGRYRVKNATGEGFHIVFSLVGDPDKDDEGLEYYNVSVAMNKTGLAFPYGVVWITDVASWQGDESFQSYNVFYPGDGYLDIWAAYSIGAGASTFQYAHDYFIPDAE